MTDTEYEIFGHLSALEFVIEIMLANELAAIPSSASDAFKADVIGKAGYISKGPVDVEVMEKIAAHTSERLQKLIAKVAEREAQIRSKVQ